MTPFTAVALLSDWERVLGLSVSSGMTIQARRQQIMAKLNETGGLSRSYFIRLAKSLGYDITIDEPEPFRCGRNRCGDRLWIPFVDTGNCLGLDREYSGWSGAGLPLPLWQFGHG